MIYRMGFWTSARRLVACCGQDGYRVQVPQHPKDSYIYISTSTFFLTDHQGEMDYRFHAAHLDRGLTIHEAVPGGFNRAGEGL